MDRKQLRALLAVVEHRSFSAAARSLGTVQSNVSAHVARLEKELDLPLIDRATLEPTYEGQAVIERARRIEAEFDALDSDVASLRDVIAGSVRVGVIGTTARWLVPGVLNALADSYPEISAVVLDATTSSLVLNLINGTIDLAVVNLPVNQDELVVEPLFDEDRVLIVPANHPLYDAEEVELEELLDHELLLEAPGTPFRSVLETAAAESGRRLRPKAEFDGMRLLTSLAMAGFGAGIVPASAAPTAVVPTTDGDSEDTPPDGTGQGVAFGDWRSIRLLGAPGRSVGLVTRRRALPSAAQRVVAATLHEVVTTAGVGIPGVRPVNADGAR